MIEYRTSLLGISAIHLRGRFFVGWTKSPSPEAHMRILQGSDYVVLAIDDETGSVVGVVTAISDGELSAYIPLLEVLEDYQSHGIGAELVSRMLGQLADHYMIDLLCDEHLQPWYERLGMRRSTGMLVRNYEFQTGRNSVRATNA